MPTRSPPTPLPAAPISPAGRFLDALLKRPGLMLALLVLSVHLPGFVALPPVDRDESRFAQASRQMLESIALPMERQDSSLHGGGWVVPRVQGRDRLVKPPLTYWLQATAAGMLTLGNPDRDAIWMYRIPSLLAALVAVLTTWRLGVSLFGAPAGLLAAAMLALCPLVAWETRQARADMILLACTTVAMLNLWRAAAAPSPASFHSDEGTPPAPTKPITSWSAWPSVAFFWLAVGLGILTKGPLTPLVAALTIGTLCLVRRDTFWVTRLCPLWGMAIVFLMVGPWAWMVASRVGWSVYLDTIIAETVGRSISAREGHWGPPGYHLLLFPALFWPGSLLTASAVARAWRMALQGSRGSGRWRWDPRRVRPGDPALLFCLSWLLPSWVVFELVGTKLPHYTLPLYPAAALLSADFAVRATRELAGSLWQLAVSAWVVLGLVVVALPAAVLVIAGEVSTGHAIVGLGIAALAGRALYLGIRSLRQGHVGAAHVAALGAMFLGIIATLGVLLPAAKAPWISPQLVHLIPSHAAAAAWGYHEDSLVFLRRGRLDRIEEPDAGAWWQTHPHGVMVLPAARILGIHNVMGTVRGFNYSKGRWEHLGVVTLGRPSEDEP